MMRVQLLTWLALLMVTSSARAQTKVRGYPSGRKKGKGNSSKSSKSSKGSGKKGKGGKGKGKGKSKGGVGKQCTSSVARAIAAEVSEATTQNPERCCNFEGPTAVYVTHAQLDDSTSSGFELFWDEVYQQIIVTSSMAHVCFVMTGYDQDFEEERSLSEILIDVNSVASSLPDVPVIMTTDPTDSIAAVEQVREISEGENSPSIGVFNAGYTNLLIEALVSGKPRLPYIGYLDDRNYGVKAGEITLELLDGIPAIPLCFNARLGTVDFIGERCSAYYNAVDRVPFIGPTGVACSSETSSSEIYLQLVDSNANAVWSHIDCCAAVARAALSIRGLGRRIVVGCQDEDTSGGLADFITAQPIELQAYLTSSWANFPVLQSLQGNDGRGEQYFPSLQSLVNTAIFNLVV